MKLLKSLVAAALVSSMASCISAPFVPPIGMAFTEIKAPLDVDYKDTEVSSKTGRAESQADLAQTFAQAGVNPDRLTFFPRSNMADYLALHHQVDVCLDTFPYNGGTTTAHASWMGVPTLTLAGETPPSRVGARFMSRFGLDGFVASSIEDFVDKGRYWAEHLTELAALRPLIRERFNASEIGQPEPFADHLDTLLRTLWQRWCQDLPPISLAIERKPQNQ